MLSSTLARPGVSLQQRLVILQARIDLRLVTGRWKEQDDRGGSRVALNTSVTEPAFPTPSLFPRVRMLALAHIFFFSIPRAKQACTPWACHATTLRSRGSVKQEEEEEGKTRCATDPCGPNGHLLIQFSKTHSGQPGGRNRSEQGKGGGAPKESDKPTKARRRTSRVRRPDPTGSARAGARTGVPHESSANWGRKLR